MFRLHLIVGILVLFTAGCSGSGTTLRSSRETHFKNIRQLTFAGENAEAYWSPDGKQLVFQATRDGGRCDAIYVMAVDASSPPERISSGEGQTTCAYWFPDQERILYATTHHNDLECPPRPDHSKGYVWPIHDFDLYVWSKKTGKSYRLFRSNGYDAEATIHWPSERIVFTSMWGKDLDIYSMDLNGTHHRRLTKAKGYDGGPFFSRDGKKIVYRAHHPEDAKELTWYEDLLGQKLVAPSEMNLWVMDANGSNKRQITDLPGAQFAPSWHPDNKRIIFSSNHGTPKGREFDLYSINEDGTDLQQVTFTDGFDGFPEFSPDGKQLVWSSNRNNAKKGDTNIFVAEWVE